MSVGRCELTGKNPTAAAAAAAPVRCKELATCSFVMTYAHISYTSLH
jgi:hypothetical protein